MSEFKEPDNEAWPQPVRLHAVRYLALLLVLGLALHFFLPRIATFEESLRVARRLSWWPLLFAAAAQVLSYVANGWALSASVAISDERLPLRRAIAIVTAASTVSLLAGGVFGFGASVYRWTRDAGTRRDTATIAATVPAMFNGAALVAFGLVSAAILLQRGELSRSAALGVGIVTTLLLGGLGAAFFAVFSPMRLASLPLLRRLGLAETLAVARAAILRGGAFRIAAATVLNLAFDLVCLDCVLIATGHDTGVLVLLGGYGVSLLLGRSSLLPGGVAVVEVTMTGSYAALGVPVEVAVVAILVYRMFSFWLPSLVGIPVAIWLQTRRPDHATA